MVLEIWSMTDKIFCNFPLYLNFEKMKKNPGDIIIAQMWTINENHKIYGSWDIKRETNFFCHFGSFFLCYSTKNLKNPNFEKMEKTTGNITNLNKCTKNHDDMQYCSWIWCVTDVFFFNFIRFSFNFNF